MKISDPRLKKCPFCPFAMEISLGEWIECPNRYNHMPFEMYGYCISRKGELSNLYFTNDKFRIYFYIDEDKSIINLEVRPNYLKFKFEEFKIDCDINTFISQDYLDVEKLFKKIEKMMIFV